MEDQQTAEKMKEPREGEKLDRPAAAYLRIDYYLRAAAAAAGSAGESSAKMKTPSFAARLQARINCSQLRGFTCRPNRDSR